MRRTATTLCLGVLALTLIGGAQTKAPPSFADYGQWETIAPAGGRGGLSPDGQFLAYSINRSNRNNELRVTKLADVATTLVAFGAQPAYSADSKWIAYSIGQSEAEQEKLRADRKPVRNNAGLLDLTTNKTWTFENIESFAFSPDGAYLALRPYGPERPSGSTEAAPGGGRGGRDQSADPDDSPGTTLMVRHLATGRAMTFGNVSQFAWQDSRQSHLLAMIISAAGKTGNGVHLYDAATGMLRVLDSSASIYTDLAWRKDSADLAVLRAKTDDRREGGTYAVLAWTGLDKAERLRIVRSDRRRGVPGRDADGPVPPALVGRRWWRRVCRVREMGGESRGGQGAFAFGYGAQGGGAPAAARRLKPRPWRSGTGKTLPSCRGRRITPTRIGDGTCWQPGTSKQAGLCASGGTRSTNR